MLIIDDHPLIHETLTAMVQKAIPGATVHVQSELGAALAQAKGLANLRIALLDLGLPGYTGIEALLRFRSALPEVRVIVVSATDDPITMERAIAAGAAWYLPKTAKPYAMVAAIKSTAGA
ncbi:MAG: response regulator [Burkholderiales bacterium]